MGFAPLYLLNRFAFRISDFFHHWYVDGSRAFGHRTMEIFRSLDRIFALRITIYYFWKPLYGDYSVIGRILGVIFRAFRALIATVLYAILATIAIALYILWLAIPFTPLFLAYRTYIIS